MNHIESQSHYIVPYVRKRKPLEIRHTVRSRLRELVYHYSETLAVLVVLKGSETFKHGTALGCHTFATSQFMKFLLG